MKAEVIGLTTYNDYARQYEIDVVPQMDMLTAFWVYFHEAGHILSRRGSFEHILRPSNSLTNKKILTWPERAYLRSVAQRTDGRPIAMRGFKKMIADHILRFYSHGVWDGHTTTRVTTPERLLKRMEQKNAPLSMDLDILDGIATPIFKYTREGRNDELPAYFVQAACMEILTYNLGLRFECDTSDEEYRKSSHGRASRLAEYLHRKGMYAPSDVDLAMRLRD